VQVMSHLLASWNVPPNVFLPLKFASDEYSSLVRLSEPLRTRTELVKVAIALGRLAVGDWHSWDLVQLPSSALLKRLRIPDVTGLLETTTADLAKLAGFSLHEKPHVTSESPKPIRTVSYVSLANSEHDLLRQLLPSMGIQPQPCSPDELESFEELAIVNCMSVPPKRLAAVTVGDRTTLVTTQEKRASFERLGRTIALPTSYGELSKVLAGPPAEEEADVSPTRKSWTSRIAGRNRVSSKAGR
jgi:hypothetical protein